MRASHDRWPARCNRFVTNHVVGSPINEATTRAYMTNALSVSSKRCTLGFGEICHNWWDIDQRSKHHAACIKQVTSVLYRRAPLYIRRATIDWWRRLTQQPLHGNGWGLGSWHTRSLGSFTKSFFGVIPTWYPDYPQVIPVLYCNHTRMIRRWVSS